MALVTLMQFRENLSDRHAAEAVRARIDWKYLLALDLGAWVALWTHNAAHRVSGERQGTGRSVVLA